MSRNVNPTQDPYDTVVLVQSYFPNGTPNGITAYGSGVVVGRNDVLTASHMVYDLRYGGEAQWTKVISGYTPGNTSGTYGKFTSVKEQYFDNVTDGGLYAVAGDNRAGSLRGAEADVALLSFDTAIGDKTGIMSIDYSFDQGTLNVSGYPQKSGFKQTIDTAYSSTPSSRDTYIFTGDHDITNGNSGGPLWYTGDAGATVVGIVSTTSYGANLSGHEYWLRNAMADNNYLIGDPVSNNNATTNSSSGNITLGSGNDVLDAPFRYTIAELGTGQDTVDFGATSSGNVNIQVNGTTVVVTGNGTLESVTLRNGERFEFADRTLALDENGNAGEAYRLYQAAFDRTPDEGGLGYWIRQLDNSSSLKNVANAFANSAEFKSKFGSNVSDNGFVNALYNNVLDRAADSAGARYWEQRLDNDIDRADLLISFSESAENKSLTTDAFDDGIWFS